MTQEERVCQFRKISIRHDGKVYACCNGPANAYVGNMFDENFYEVYESKNLYCACPVFKTREIKEGEKPKLKYMHLELSNYCQARCVCCMQEKEEEWQMDKLFVKIKEAVEKYRPEHIIAIGGEALVQPDSMEMLEGIKRKYPQTEFETITNLCVKEDLLKRAINLFSTMTISHLGFTENTYNREMGLNFGLTMKNIDYILENTEIKLRPKYLAMPTNLLEMPLFLEHYLDKKVEKIYLHNIMEFDRCCNLSDKYWQNTFSIIKNDIIKLLEKNKKMQNLPISMHEIIARELGLLNSDLITVTA